ncbi:DNA repair protein RecN [Thermoclostridium stercorarium]|uniref:DNA repair protein RecN n=1 Tax=Thermoclostridium stercorarium TaxID=1510 RepID=UPI0022487BED|nr:DNA repair protein RecN [Thermoclostridium stercorarium]UZQ85170.1 DNA repair protein RecN [Thermoclostridium stercorarium]
MLVQLSVENVAIIEKLTMELEDGLNILTGETGAGKSILIDAVNILLGGRVSRDIIRTGEEKAKVEAVFQVPERLCGVLNNMGIDGGEDGMLIVSRQFTTSGKNICRVNGSLVTVAQLKEIGEYLIDIHGQNDNQSLLRNQAQIDYLDKFSGGGLLKEREEYRELLEKYREIEKKISELTEKEKERARLEDLYRYQVNEIEAANLKKGEDIELLQQSKLLANAEEIIEAFNSAYTCLAGEDELVPGAIEQVQKAQAALNNIADLDPDFGTISETLVEISDRLEEIARKIRNKREEINYDPALQQEVEERLALIENLKRKYGNTVEEIILYMEDAKKKLEEVSDMEGRLAELRRQKNELDDLLYKKAQNIHNMRVKAAEELKVKITEQLKDLEMPKAEFLVEVRFDDSRNYTENGLDAIEFLISPNPGEGLKPLSKIASGGEMARIMLAIKTILADVDETGVLIFDEIDTGVSGKAALKVGEKLLEISAKHQVICITHHAQIASLAKAHYRISKETIGERTVARVEKLDGAGREKEVARLLSGDESANTAKLAREMIKKGMDLRKKQNAG